MVLGDKALLDDSVKQSYSFSGASHILAVSGLHVGILFVIINAFLSFFLRGNQLCPRIIRSVLVVSFLWLYVWITGGAASIVRSALMFSFFSFGFVFQRPYSAYASLFSSAFVLLVADPKNLFDVGFQLSYAAVLSILYFYPKIYSFCHVDEFGFNLLNNALFKHLYNGVWSMLSVSIAAQIGTFPLVLYYFHQFSLLFWLTALVALPLVTLIIYIAVAFFCFNWVPVLSSALVSILVFFSNLMNRIVGFIASLPCATIEWVDFGIVDVLLAYCAILAIVFFLQNRVRLWVLNVGFGCVCAMLVISIVSVLTSKACIAVYNSPRSTVVNLFDRGSNNVYLKGMGQNRLENQIKKFWISSHTDKPAYVNSHFFSLNGKTVFILDMPIKGGVATTGPVHVDYLVVSNDVRLPKEVMDNLFTFDKLIVDSSCSYSTVNWWRRNHYDVYSVREDGDYIERF